MSRALHIFREPDRFIAGTIGEPGDRTFYLQVVRGTRIVSVLLEKQQLQILADRVDALLVELHRRFGTDVPTSNGDLDLGPLSMPVDVEFRVGTMGLGWDAEAGAVVIELLAVTEGDIDESVVLGDTEDGPDAVRVFLTTDAAKDFATRSQRVAAAGRQQCPLCGEPLEPDGHMCVRTNGYRRAPDEEPFTFIDPVTLGDLGIEDPDSGEGTEPE